MGVDTAGLGPLSAKTKTTVSKKRWASIVKKAHKRGFAVESFLDPSVPAPLKQRTRESLVKEARRNTNEIYKPVLEATDRRQSTAIAVGKMRERALNDFKDWMIQQHGKLDAQAATNNAALRDIGRLASEDVGKGYAEAAARANAAQTGVAGNTSAGQAPAALDLQPAAQRDTQLLEAQRGQSENIIRANDGARVATEANNLAYVAAMEAQRQGDVYKALADISDERGKIVLQRASDAQREVSRLLQGEVDKASTVQQIQIGAAKLGIEQGKLDLATRKQASIELDDDFKRRLAAARLDLDQDKFDFDKLDSDRRLALDWYKARHSGKGKGGKGGSGAPKTPQARFEAAYFGLASTPRKFDSNNNPIYIDSKYLSDPKTANRRRAVVIGQIMKQFKVTKEMATRVLRAYVEKGTTGQDPGSYKVWAVGKKPAADKPRG